MTFLRIGLALAFSVAVGPHVGLGWGADGHKMVGAIAEHYLSPAATLRVRDLLYGGTLDDIATWADEIKSDRSCDYAKPLHYANPAPGADHFDMTRDVPPAGCVVTAIIDCAETLTRPNAPRGERIEALKFLAHFVGDIHQPLHLGNAHDRGGNDIKVEFFRNRTNLHRLWDSGLIRRVKNPWRDYAAELITRNDSDQVAEWSAELDPVAWANESILLARQYAYPIRGDRRLGQPYFDACIPIVDYQLRAAGVRLAALLNAIYESPTSTDRRTGGCLRR
jgi:nuclease S1